MQNVKARKGEYPNSVALRLQDSLWFTTLTAFFVREKYALSAAYRIPSQIVRV